MPGSHIFPRRERLTRRRDYLRVYAEGSKLVGRYFICYIARHEGEQRKFGMAVSRKVGNAVVRNRIKRYLREIYRTHRGELPDNVQIVCVARPSSAPLTYGQCRGAVRRLFDEGNLLARG